MSERGTPSRFTRMLRYLAHPFLPIWYFYRENMPLPLAILSIPPMLVVFVFGCIYRVFAGAIVVGWLASGNRLHDSRTKAVVKVKEQ